MQPSGFLEPGLLSHAWVVGIQTWSLSSTKSTSPLGTATGQNGICTSDACFRQWWGHPMNVVTKSSWHEASMLGVKRLQGNALLENGLLRRLKPWQEQAPSFVGGFGLN